MKRCGVYFVLFCVTTTSCTKQNSSPLPIVEVELNEPVDTIKGATWPRNSDRTAVGVQCVQNPCTVKIGFPGGRVYSSYSKILFVNQQDGKVWIVDVSPFEHAQPYEQAVTSVAGIVADIEKLFAVPAELSVQREILGWKLEKPMWGTKSTRIELEERVSLFIQLKYSDSGREAWFPSLVFAYEEPGK